MARSFAFLKRTSLFHAEERPQQFSLEVWRVKGLRKLSSVEVLLERTDNCAALGEDPDRMIESSRYWTTAAAAAHVSLRWP